MREQRDARVLIVDEAHQFDDIIPFGDRLFAVPVSSLWSQ